MPNPGVTTLAAIRTAAQSRADMINSQFVTTSEWLEYINGSYFELYDLLIQKFGNDYFVAIDGGGKGFQFTTNGTSQMYPLPDGSTTYKMPDGSTAPAFYKLLGLEVQLDSKAWDDVPRFNFGDRNNGVYPPASPRTSLRYKLLGSNIQLLSGRTTPGANLVLQAWYAPRLTALANDSDTVDGVSGWEDYIKVDAAIKALTKEESDTSALEREKAALRQRIEEAAENRDEARPQSVSDVRSNRDPWSDVGWF